MRLAPPASVSGLRPSRATLENACAFPQLRTLAGSNPMHQAQTKTVPLRGPFPIQWWAMRDVACGWRRPLSLRRFAPRVLRWKTLTRFLGSAPLRVRIPLRWAQKRKAPIAGGLIIQVVGDEGCRVRLAPPAFASGLRPSRAALENAYAFPQLRTLAGSNPMHWAQKRKAPVAGSLTKQVVGDEGFEPPALCV